MDSSTVSVLFLWGVFVIVVMLVMRKLMSGQMMGGDLPSDEVRPPARPADAPRTSPEDDTPRAGPDDRTPR
jgi:hypothetical protein